jgi:hypothetical protein
MASLLLLFLDTSYNGISFSIPMPPAAPGPPQPPPSSPPSGDLGGCPAGLCRLAAAAEEADGSQNQGISRRGRITGEEGH